MKIKRKHQFTIMELMIWIFIISIIGGVMTHNMKGSLKKGKSFKTETAGKEAYDILSLQIAGGSNITKVLQDPHKALKNSGLVQSPSKLLKDGWGKDFILVPTNDDDFILYSKTWVNYLINDREMSIEEIEENYPWGFNAEVINEVSMPS